MREQSQLKMFHFEYENYGVEATVCAGSLEQARAILEKEKARLVAVVDGDIEVDDDIERILAKHRIDDIDAILAGEKYKAVVYEPGQVLWTEVS